MNFDHVVTLKEAEEAHRALTNAYLEAVAKGCSPDTLESIRALLRFALPDLTVVAKLLIR
jgi:hypothetical protein